MSPRAPATRRAGKTVAARRNVSRAPAEGGRRATAASGNGSGADRSSTRFEFHPLTPERWADLETLFGQRGACGGCWCMWPRVARSEFERGKGDANRRAFRRIVSAGDPPGILAYAGGAPAGWCAIGPRAGFRRLEKSRVLEPVDDRPVWSVVCFFVARPHRGRGLSVALLEEAVRFARARGATIVEGYPVEPRGPARAADAFVWTGLPSTFRRAGFDEALRRSPTRPIMRRVLARSAASRSAKRTAGRARG